MGRAASKGGPDRGAAARGPSKGVARHVARVAARLFAARGYDATSVREVVEAAGVTKPTLYYHFGSKQGLAQALLVRPLEGLLAALRRHLGPDVDPVAGLAGMIEEHFAFCREDPDRSRFVYALFFGPLGSGLAAEMMRIGGELDRVMHAGVERLAAAGLIAPGRARHVLASLRGLIIVHTVDYLYRGEDLGFDLSRRLVTDLLEGFGVTGRSGANS